MATIISKLVYRGAKANLPASRNADSFYLCTDTHELYFGAELYTEPVRFYNDTANKPATPAQGVLYIDEATGKGEAWNGTTWVVVIKGYISTIADGVDDTTVPTSKAVKDYVDGKTSGIATDDALNTLAGRVSTLEDSDAGKSVRAIANEELASQLIPENAKESLNTLAEIAAWIQGHPDDASAMNAAIAKLQAIVAGIGGEGEKATVADYVTDAIAALKIGDYAKAADLTALAARVTAAEGKLDTLTGADTVEGSVAKALKDAKAYTDEKDTAMDSRMDAVEGKAHEHANKAELDKFADGDKANLDAVVEALTVGTF